VVLSAVFLFGDCGGCTQLPRIRLLQGEEREGKEVLLKPFTETGSFPSFSLNPFSSLPFPLILILLCFLPFPPYPHSPFSFFGLTDQHDG